ncbi:hypothetical protein ACHAQH_003751 [Verticillium albo-atrum]
MCIKLSRRYYCPKTETGTLGPDPEETGSLKRRFWGSKQTRYGTEASVSPYALNCYVEFSNTDEGAMEGHEIHVCEMIVECGEPRYTCRDLNTMEERYEDIPKHHCPMCLRIPDFPRAPEGTSFYKCPIPDITDSFDRGQAMSAFDQYLDGILSLTKTVLTVQFADDESWQMYVSQPEPETLAGLFFSMFCREDDRHHGYDWYQCVCPSSQQQYPEASNLGRMLRLAEVGAMAEHHANIFARCVMRDENGAEINVKTEKDWNDTINERWRRMCLDPEERITHWSHPEEDTRYAECIAQLEHEVARILIEGPTAIDHENYDQIVGAQHISKWDSGKYTLFVRSLAAVITPALAWICYDTGLANEQVALFARVLFTLLDHNRASGRPPIPGFPEGQQPTIPASMDEIWSIMYIICDHPLSSPAHHLNQKPLAVRIQAVKANIELYKRRRAAIFAERSLRLDYAWLLLGEKSTTVQAIIDAKDASDDESDEQQPSSGNTSPPPPSCTVCDEVYDDDDKLRRPTLLCPELRHHICARCCLRIVLESELRAPDVRCVMCRRGCSEWTMLSDRTDRDQDPDAQQAEMILGLYHADPEI